MQWTEPSAISRSRSRPSPISRRTPVQTRTSAPISNTTPSVIFNHTAAVTGGMARKEVLAYLAGVMDSDGYLSIRKTTWGRRHGRMRAPGYHARIGAKQVIPGVAIHLLQRTFGGSVRTDKPTAKRGKQLIGWEVTNAAAIRAVRNLLPYLRIKRLQAQTILAFQRAKMRCRSGRLEILQKTRWGSLAKFRKAVYSEDEISLLESFYVRLRGLNDSRGDPYHHPKL